MLHPAEDDLICVSALPPFAFAAAAKLCAQFRKEYPQVKIMACIWGFPPGREALLAKIEKSTRMVVATTLSQALQQTIAEETLEPTAV